MSRARKTKGATEPKTVPSKPKIRDLTLYQWLFFLRWHSRESKADRDSHAREFHEALKEGWRWVGAESAPPALPEATDHLLQVSQRLASLGWQEHNGTLRELEARTLLDAFYLQVAQAREVGTPLDGLASLAPSFNRFTPTAQNTSQSRHASYLGEAMCMCVELESTPMDEEIEAPAVKVVEWWRERSDPPLQHIRLPFGLLTLVPDEAHPTLVLTYAQCFVQQVSRFLHSVLPPLLLSLVKGRVIEDAYYKELLLQVQQEEKELDDLLKSVKTRALRLEALEKLGVAISIQQSAFIESLSQLEEQLHTLKVNQRNIELLLEEPTWGDQRQWARQCFTDRMALLIEQMESDLHYLRITQQQADLVLQSLTIVASVREARWERHIALLVLAFTVIAVAEVFASELPWWARLAMIVTGIPIGILIGIWWVRRH